MPKSWAQTFENMSPEHLAELLLPNQPGTCKTVWPLSLLSLRTLVQQLSIDREQVECTTNPQVNINKLNSKLF